jgi:hypothetical protein
MDNEKQPEKQIINPTVIIGNTAFKVSDILDENNTEVKAKLDEWMAKKEKAFERAEKAKQRKRRTYKKRKL